MSYCLVDLNQVLISSLMVHLKTLKPNDEVKSQEDLIRHICINSLRSNVKQFKSKYPNVILACDNKHYWRRDYFPFYKANRKHDREASEYDWAQIFDVLGALRDDLRVHFPYKVLNVEGAEADDVIAVLTKKLSAENNILILSGDKDFSQLQKYPNVSQYSPNMARWIVIDDPLRYIKEHVIRGDRGDGIPNILSPDNTFVSGERQKRLTSKKLVEWLEVDDGSFCNTDQMKHGYKRNQVLVDFDYIPTDIQNNILTQFEATKPAPKSKLLDYFIDKNLKTMIECINDF